MKFIDILNLLTQVELLTLKQGYGYELRVLTYALSRFMLIKWVHCKNALILFTILNSLLFSVLRK